MQDEPAVAAYLLITYNVNIVICSKLKIYDFNFSNRDFSLTVTLLNKSNLISQN